MRFSATLTMIQRNWIIRQIKWLTTFIVFYHHCN